LTYFKGLLERLAGEQGRLELHTVGGDLL